MEKYSSLWLGTKIIKCIYVKLWILIKTVVRTWSMCTILIRTDTLNSRSHNVHVVIIAVFILIVCRGSYYSRSGQTWVSTTSAVSRVLSRVFFSARVWLYVIVPLCEYSTCSHLARCGGFAHKFNPLTNLKWNVLFRQVPPSCIELFSNVHNKTFSVRPVPTLYATITRLPKDQKFRCCQLLISLVI